VSGLGRGVVRDLVARHGIRPSKSLGQHFLIDPNLALAIVADAGIGPGDRVVEIGAGLGSLTLALASTGAHVLAVEFDRRLEPALVESLGSVDGVEIRRADATKMDWARELPGGGWTMCANLPYNIAVPVVMEALEQAPIDRFVVMVQREVGERLVAAPGEEEYGAVSVRVAYRATGRIMRRVPPEVFWPAPAVESVVVRLDRLEAPPVRVPADRLFAVVDAGFAERRKTMRNALRRMGYEGARADEVLHSAGVDPRARAESLGLQDFASIAEALAT
jgi:16S rRNA (adenine1518-N6/adenine1519-N6)-dimethyltransferase